MVWRTFAALLVAAGCSVPNPNHCGNLDGDATCRGRDPGRPYCSLCVGADDGCVAAPVAEPGCGFGGATGTSAATTTGAAATTSSSATGPDPSTSGVTSTGADASTGTTGTSTTDATTGSGTTDMTSGTGSSGTTDPGPMCGNGVREGMEGCDGEDFGGKTCLDFGTMYGGGMLACSPQCTVLTGGCCKAAGVQCGNKSECCSMSCPLGFPPFKCD